jgi:hypothetical protein
MSLSLNTAPNFHRPGQVVRQAYSAGDEFYERLIEAHRGLSDGHSRLLNARLVLLLANHVGDLGVLQQALDAARAGLPGDAPQDATGAPR